jgi:hypothetical protein
MSQKTLIILNEFNVVHPSEIQRAGRNGNYTDVWLREPQGVTPRLMQIWDEDKRLWNVILKHAE